MARPGSISTAQLAFVASNRFDYAEFLVRTPTDAGGGVLVHHFSTVVKVDWQAEYFALKADPGATSTSR